MPFFRSDRKYARDLMMRSSADAPTSGRTSADIYVFDVDPESDTAGAHVLRLVGRDKRVLEIGAGPGSTARPLKVHNNCRIVALEIDPNCVPILEKFCDRVVQGDLSSPNWHDALRGEQFDAIVIADVLEHLVDPWATLRTATTLLKPDGFVVCSMPNASHAAILACFATDDVEYREHGLLDKTHLRFFGIRNLQQLFQQADLRIVDALYVVRPPEFTEFAGKWDTVPRFARRALTRGRFSQVYQTVVKATFNSNGSQAEFNLIEHPPKKQRVPLYYRLASQSSRQRFRQLVTGTIGESGWNSLKRMMRM
jgi:2-polyprenyl-3-methyl-5-hydroxy-6-metoxy-1,4-benzoquinol methylase